jgi:phosphatidylserine decarboxylase
MTSFDSLLLGLALSLATTLPLAWKWALGLTRSMPAVLVLGVAAGLTVEVFWTLSGAPDGVFVKAGAQWALTLTAALAFLAYRFYRDPERSIPSMSNAIVSPADGEVLYVRRSRNGVLPVSTKQGRDYTLMELTKTPLETGEATVIGIGMSFLDVHVNRAPIAGRIAVRRHFPGLFGSLRQPAMAFENERATTVLERDDLQVAVVQIASRMVRQIVSFVDEGQEVALGERIGMIRLGSQVDLVLPLRTDLAVTAKPGDRVTAGQSVVAVLPLQPGDRPEVARTGVLLTGPGP